MGTFTCCISTVKARIYSKCAHLHCAHERPLPAQVIFWFLILSEIKECQDHEMEEFPKRMRDWLYLIMEELVRIHYRYIITCLKNKRA